MTARMIRAASIFALAVLAGACGGTSGESSTEKISIGSVMDRSTAVIAGRVRNLEPVSDRWSRMTFDVERVVASATGTSVPRGPTIDMPIPRGWTYEGLPAETKEFYGSRPPPVTSGGVVMAGEDNILFVRPNKARPSEWLLSDRGGIWGWDGRSITWPGSRLHIASLRAGAERGDVVLAPEALGIRARLEIGELVRVWERERTSPATDFATYKRWPPGT